MRGRTAQSRAWAPTRTLSSNAQIREDAAVLEGAREAELGEPFGRKARDRPAVEQDLARVRGVEARDEIEERGLAGPVRADDADELVLVNREIDGVHGRQAAEAPGQAADLEQHHTVPNRPCGRKRISSSSTSP